MLGTLDPHSSSSTRANTRRCASGRRAVLRLGIQIVSLDGDITATSVFEGSPPIRRESVGDIISKIGGDDAKGWTTEQAMRKLRGAKARRCTSRFKRRGYEQVIPSKWCATRCTSRRCRLTS